MRFARSVAATAVVAVLGATSCSPAEKELWTRWFAEEPEAASGVAGVAAASGDGVAVLSPAEYDALAVFVAGLEARPDTAREVAAKLACERWGCEAFAAVDYIISRESGYNPSIVNAGSGACGIPQALPCRRLPGFPFDATLQLQWMYDYIDARYGGPFAAMAHWKSYGWY